MAKDGVPTAVGTAPSRHARATKARGTQSTKRFMGSLPRSPRGSLLLLEYQMGSSLASERAPKVITPPPSLNVSCDSRRRVTCPVTRASGPGAHLHGSLGPER